MVLDPAQRAPAPLDLLREEEERRTEVGDLAAGRVGEVEIVEAHHVHDLVRLEVEHLCGQQLADLQRVVAVDAEVERLHRSARRGGARADETHERLRRLDAHPERHGVADERDPPHARGLRPRLVVDVAEAPAVRRRRRRRRRTAGTPTAAPDPARPRSECRATRPRRRAGATARTARGPRSRRRGGTTTSVSAALATARPTLAARPRVGRVAARSCSIRSGPMDAGTSAALFRVADGRCGLNDAATCASGPRTRRRPRSPRGHRPPRSPAARTGGALAR